MTEEQAVLRLTSKYGEYLTAYQLQTMIRNGVYGYGLTITTCFNCLDMVLADRHPHRNAQNGF